MKTNKILVAALGLSLALTACTKNLAPVNPEVSGEVTGAVLVGTDLSLDITKGVVDTRLNTDENGAAYWEENDEVGVAWFNVTTGTITADQDLTNWPTLTATDTKIYTNHRFAFKDGRFTSSGNLFEGGYFAYHPFQRLGSVQAALIYSAPAEQKSLDAKTQYLNNAFSLSPRDRVKKGDVNAQNEINRTFELFPVVNAFSVKTQIGSRENISAAIWDNMKIQQVSIKVAAVTGEEGFRTTAKIKPQSLPYACFKDSKYDESDQYDAGKTKEEFYKNGAFMEALDNSTYLASISTDLKFDHPVTRAMTEDTDGIVLFSLPLKAQNTSAVSIEVKTNLGIFTIAKVTDAAAGSDDEFNNLAIAKLQGLLSDAGWKDEAGVAHSMVKKVIPMRAALKVKLTGKQFVKDGPDFNVSTVDDWNAACQILATGDPDYRGGKIILKKDITITPESLPAVPVVVTSSAAEALTLGAGTFAFPRETYIENLKVGKGATLVMNSPTSYFKTIDVTEGVLSVPVGKTIAAGAETIDETSVDDWSSADIQYHQINVKSKGTLSVAGTMIVDVVGALTTETETVEEVTSDSKVEVLEGGLLKLVVGLINKGQLNVAGRVDVFTSGLLTNAGTINLNGRIDYAANGVIVNNKLVNVAQGGRFNVTTANDYTITNSTASSIINLAVAEDVFMAEGKAYANSLVVNGTDGRVTAPVTVDTDVVIQEMNAVKMTGSWDVADLKKVIVAGIIDMTFYDDMMLDITSITGTAPNTAAEVLANVKSVNVLGNVNIVAETAPGKVAFSEGALARLNVARGAMLTIGSKVKLGLGSAIVGLTNAGTIDNFGSFAFQNNAAPAKTTANTSVITNKKDAVMVVTAATDFSSLESLINNGELINEGKLYAAGVVNGNNDSHFTGKITAAACTTDVYND